MLLSIPHNSVKLFVELTLIGDVLSNIADKKTVARCNEIVVKRVAHGESVHSLFDPEHSYVCNLEITHQLLILRVRRDRIHVEKNKVILTFLIFRSE